MNIKPICCAVLFLATSTLCASNILKLSNHPLSMVLCEFVQTDNVLDMALANDGYFMLSNGENDGGVLFTRYGNFRLNSESQIVNESGLNLLGINKKSAPNKLSKLKIPTNNLPPKTTSKIDIAINLPTMASDDEVLTTTTTLYDSISKHHELKVDYKKISHSTWTAQVSIDNVSLNQGTLYFDNSGVFSKQDGLSHIQWQTDFGVNDLKIDHTESTATASPFSIQLIANNGYPVGSLSRLEIDINGFIFLVYSNGQSKRLKHTIAVAKFLNPNYLKRVQDHLYMPTDKSGPLRLHRLNSAGAILTGNLEPDPCPNIA